ncbi:MAG TPA: GNAT family N-acetyltransferase [Terriglobales bacterium]|nr:GNAT family N-acetyltransferase [Terriglobales bacterium]
MRILETERLILRELVMEDAGALARVISDPETMRYYPAPFDRGGVEQWIERNRARYLKDGHGLWGMVLKSCGELIGDCGLIRQEVDGESLVEIGYHVCRDQWGKGLAPEAAKACRDYGFTRLGERYLISLIRPENFPSRRVAEKVGMTLWKTTLWRDLPHCVYRIFRSSDKARPGLASSSA